VSERIPEGRGIFASRDAIAESAAATWKLCGADASGKAMTLAVGDKAPNFTLTQASGEAFTLAEALGRRSVVLFFYPKDDTPGCTVEACTFRDQYDAFAEAGAEVVGVSSDSSASHNAFASKHKLPMTLLTDAGGKVRAQYGIKATLGLFPGRATFVIDRSGAIVHVFESQLRVKSHVENALAVVKRLEQQPSAVPARP
jgi:peroxiredoxin Q/BCP